LQSDDEEKSFYLATRGNKMFLGSVDCGRNKKICIHGCPFSYGPSIFRGT